MDYSEGRNVRVDAQMAKKKALKFCRAMEKKNQTIFSGEIEEIVPSDDVLTTEMRRIYGGGKALRILKILKGGGTSCKSGCSQGSENQQK